MKDLKYLAATFTPFAFCAPTLNFAAVSTDAITY